MVNLFRLLSVPLMGALMAACSAEAATEIGLCRDNREGGSPYVSAKGAEISVVVGEAAHGCPSIRIPVNQSDVVWAGLMPKMVRPGVPLALSGTFQTDRAVISEVEEIGPESRPPAAPPAPLPGLRPFGVEERARIREGGLVCAAGGRPAGMVVEAATNTHRLRLSYRSDMAVEAGGSNGKDGPMATTVAPPAPGRGTLLVPGSDNGLLTVACLGAGTFDLLSLGPPASGWAWHPALWQTAPEDLLARAAAWGMDTVFVSVPVGRNGVGSPQSLAAFIARANAMGIAVWAVDGDPRAVLPGEQGRFVERAQAYDAFNRSVPAVQRLAGLQLDIEPYVVPGYAQDPDSFDRAWAATITAIATATSLPVEAVVPFWFGTESHRKIALDPVSSHVESIAVMAYRGDAGGIAAAAEDLLSWGQLAGIPVRVAIENGPIPDEERLVFRPAPTGTLWQVDIEGQAVAILLKAPASNLAGATLGLASRSTVPGRRISFLGDENALNQAVDTLQWSLGGHPAFHGLAIHGILD